MKKLILLFLLFIWFNLYSQKKKFIVLDKGSKSPVEYCNILVVGESKGQYSNINGHVAISDFHCDSLLISHVLYNKLKIHFDSIKDTVWLSKKKRSLNEFVVYPSKESKKWSREKKEKHQWYIQPKTEFCVLLERHKNIETISSIRFPIEYLTDLRDDKIERAVFMLNIYSNFNGFIKEKLKSITCSLTDKSDFIEFDLGKTIALPKEGLFLGIEFIGFEDSNKNIIENKRNKFIKLSFSSTKESKTFYSNKFINSGKWSLLKKNNPVFPFELKNGLSLIFIYK